MKRGAAVGVECKQGGGKDAALRETRVGGPGAGPVGKKVGYPLASG